ncbi:MAG: glutathione S-transferase family protein [Pseudomonadota bacterium]
MYTVIGHPMSRALRVIWALEELRLAYTLDPQPPRGEKVAALNGTGKIPVLQTPEGAITDSVAILTYLADKHGALTHPAGSQARAVQDGVTNYIVAELDAALWLYAKHSFVLPAELRVTAVKDVARAEFAQAMDTLAQMKGDQRFMAGDTFTIADILLSHCAGWGLSRKFALPGGAMGDFLKSLRKRPARERVSAIAAKHS